MLAHQEPQGQVDRPLVAMAVILVQPRQVVWRIVEVAAEECLDH